jgi:SagB-type dehydrogenase family enzyme
MENSPRQLPPPDAGERVSFERTVANRRTVREFDDRSLSLEQISQICWAGQGITDERDGLRAAPSAGALYPVELYIVTEDGVDHYEPAGHRMRRHLEGDVRPLLRRAALDQEMITDAPVCVAIAVVVDRVSRKYGSSRGERYCFLEVGHVAQNVLLQAQALGLAGTPIGAYEDRSVASAMKLPKGQRVIYLIPIGYPRRG